MSTTVGSIIVNYWDWSAEADALLTAMHALRRPRYCCWNLCAHLSAHIYPRCVLYGVMGTAFVSSVENSLDRKILLCSWQEFLFSSLSLFLVSFYRDPIVGENWVEEWLGVIGTSLGRVNDRIVNYYNKIVTVVKLSFNYLRLFNNE